jgi:hypothetical protein
MTAAAAVFGGGNRDTDLSRADQLIKEKKYDEAIRILTEYARRSPEHFDLAQQRLRVIYRIRDEFNRLADELIDTFLNDPDNSEKILALSKQMEELEAEGSPLLLSFVSRTREIASFNVARSQLQGILVRGRALLDSGESDAAIQMYSGGMAFLRNEFFTAGYGEEIDSYIRRETDSVNYAVGAFRQESENLGALAAELVRAINSGELERAPEIISRLEPAMDSFIGLKINLYEALDAFDRTLAELQADDPEMGDRNHLSFLSRVIVGRTGEPIQEGMLGAFDLYWENSVGQIVSAIMDQAVSINSSGFTAFGNAGYSEAITVLREIESYVGLSPLFFDKNRLFMDDGKRRMVQLFGDDVLYDDIPSYTNLKSMNEASGYLTQAAGLAGQVDTLVNVDRSSLNQWRDGRINAQTALNIEQQTRDTIMVVRNEVDAVIDSANQMDALINAYHNTVYIRDAVNLIENMYSAVIAEGRQSAYRYYTIANYDLYQSLLARREELARGRNYLDGQSRQRSDGTFVTDHYPSEALEILSAMLPILTGDLARGNSLMAYYRNEPSSVLTDEEISGIYADSRGTVNELNDIHAQALALAETARSRAALAETHRQEGERLVREAQLAYQRQNFDTARDRLQRASDRFNNSLDLQESPSLRQSWDNQMIALGEAISNAENEMIIVEVRNLVNEARVTYFAGDFQRAEDSLLRARNRWRVTNSSENDEIIYWLGIVRNAMSARSGRVIPPTAPLYPEMSQLLSEARKKYEEGVRLINSGNRSQGLLRFDEARQFTREVKLMFPVNQEAGILELRMEQFTDPTAFNASFEQRLRTAVAGSRQRSIESFADLQNLAEINPGYPGIRAIVYQAEIDMGYRPPPPDPRDLARSNELTAAASRIVDENVTALYDVALTQINEALALNPENTAAARVKDRLLGRMSVPGAIVLSSEDEEEYQRAVRELQAGNNLIAFAIVERLMQNPRNRNITKLIELQRRIQSVS